MTTENVAGRAMPTAATARTPNLKTLVAASPSIGTMLGPLVGLLIWLLPLGLEPAAHKACAIAGFMVIYWITVPIEYGLTALCGCFLFWAMDVTTFAVAFSGFTSSAPWFVFGALLIGQAAARTGLAKRLGYMVMQRVGNSYSRLLFGMIMFALLLQFLVPAPNAQITILASVAIGIVAVFEAEPRSNVGKGLFLALTFASYLFSRMFLAGAPAILTRGIVEEQAGVQILWSHWALAFLPVTFLTLISCWLIISWLYPPETRELAGGAQSIQDALQEMGPWRSDELKTLLWLILAIALWATDLLHHLHPALIGIGIALILTLPTVGVLDITAVKSVNFLLIIFLGGAISLGNVLVETHALASVTENLIAWINPLLATPLSSALTLYWGGFLYHFPIPNAQAMVITALPILLDIAAVHQYNPMAVGLLWLFASAGTLFTYQAASFVLGYSYGYFEAVDLFKVGAVLTVVEGLFILLLVPLYWPLVGLAWTTAPSEQHMVSVPDRARPVDMTDDPTTKETLPGYTVMASAARNSPVAATPGHAVPPEAETAAWASIRDSNDPHDFITFLKTFPHARFNFAARMRLKQLRSQPPAAAVPTIPLPTRQIEAPSSRRRPQIAPQFSPLVQYSQRRLQQLGIDPGPPDGFYGPRTAAALRLFQIRRGLPATGRLDAGTRQALWVSAAD